MSVAFLEKNSAFLLKFNRERKTKENCGNSCYKKNFVDINGSFKKSAAS